ncbi:sce7726 family protein [Campylobacter sp. RM16188]|uniref:sce7726 family protein n=1 Tax=Campylobacter sp. RM16188 TaxID=1705725 RepID=UPI0015518F32|nr:sce7726 family protein [Campylobacter sp. RM16188]
MQKANASIIKKSLIDWLDKKYIDKTITAEILVKTSLGDKVADVVVSNGHAIAYEIKSELDTTLRLRDQIAGFSEVFEYVYLVFWRDKFNISELNLPCNIGIIEAFYHKNKVSFKMVKKPKINNNISKYNLCSMLWADELKYFLTKKDVAFKKNADKEVLASKFCSISTNRDIIRVFRFILKYRYEKGFLSYKQNKDKKNALSFLSKNKVNRHYLSNLTL